MKKITWRKRLHYEFDNIMSRGTIALLFWLALMSLALIVGVALLDWVVGFDVREDGSRIPLSILMWMNLLRTLDPGTMGGDTGNGFFLGSMLVVTLGGIFLVSTLIGILSNGIASRLEEMRKGRSFVVEQGHTIILGWSPTVFTIIRELSNARRHEKKCIVILADRDKVAMEDEIHMHLGELPKTRVVCRTGNPLQVPDLEIVNPDDARAIVIPAPVADDPDAHVVKSLLALVNRAGRRQEAHHIVAELRDPENLAVARLVAGSEAEFVLSGDLLARLTAQACRQSGLSVVYGELLAFHGNEIYTAAIPDIVGKTYGEAQLLMDTCVLIGIETSDGRSVLGPRAEFVIQERDRAIVIAGDVSEIQTRSTPAEFDRTVFVPPVERVIAPEHTLLLGWNRRSAELISELDEYVAPESRVTVVSDAPAAEAQIKSLEQTLAHQTVRYVNSPPTSRRTLARLQIDTFDHVVVSSPLDQYPAQEADAHALITLLHLRAADHQHLHSFSITTEMLDVNNRDLAEVAHPDDFIVSTQLVSLMLVQLAENPGNSGIFASLFSASGKEIYLRPMSLYVQTEQPVSFYTLMQAALLHGEIAIGYRIARQAHVQSENYGIVLNPPKEEPIRFEAGDRLIVLAEN